MKIKIANVINPVDGNPAYQLRLRAGGYTARELPKEYISGEHFIVNPKSIAFITKLNPVTGEVSQIPQLAKIYFNGYYSGIQVERALSLMRICGERLCRIKANKANLQPIRFEDI
ncbi:hypothetical protein [Bacteroides sp.]|uniref:hypothetical protein n=1 Tax=Bacteroides sp. TaxID=29523 RepID=UPI0026095C03|nr:hypothetical protein [Bacteroides sp.]MDD3040554.1 hypothetical protein [Bacteroides sp.]